MKVLYTKHAEEKLQRADVKKFKINKKMIELILKTKKPALNTKYGDLAKISQLDTEHDLRIIYDIIDQDTKVITFHISTKGRYK